MTPHPGAGPRQGDEEGQGCGEHHLWQGDKCAGTRGHCRSGCPLCGVRGAWQSPRPNPSGHQGFLLPSLGSSATPGSVSLKFLSLNPFLPALHWLTPGSAPHPSRYPHYRCPYLEGGWWEEHCFPGPSPLTDGMGGAGEGCGGTERKGPPRHPEGPQEPDRKQPGERQQQPRPSPRGQNCRLPGALPVRVKTVIWQSIQTLYSFGPTYLIFTPASLLSILLPISNQLPHFPHFPALCCGHNTSSTPTVC